MSTLNWLFPTAAAIKAEAEQNGPPILGISGRPDPSTHPIAHSAWQDTMLMSGNPLSPPTQDQIQDPPTK